MYAEYEYEGQSYTLFAQEFEVIATRHWDEVSIKSTPGHAHISGKNVYIRQPTVTAVNHQHSETWVRNTATGEEMRWHLRVPAIQGHKLLVFCLACEPSLQAPSADPVLELNMASGEFHVVDWKLKYTKYWNPAAISFAIHLSKKAIESGFDFQPIMWKIADEAKEHANRFHGRTPKSLFDTIGKTVVLVGLGLIGYFVFIR